MATPPIAQDWIKKIQILPGKNRKHKNLFIEKITQKKSIITGRINKGLFKEECS